MTSEKENNQPPICCIFNYAPHYRLGIYQEMEKEMNCHFFFGDSNYSNIEKLDYSQLSGFQKEVKFKLLFSKFYWLQNSARLAFRPYQTFLMTGEPYCLSSWMILILNKIFGKKTYLWSHGWYGTEGKITTVIKKLFFKLSSEVFLYGEHAKSIMVAQGIEASKIHVVFNSINYNASLKLRKQLKRTNIYQEHFKNDLPTILFIGRIEPRKRIDMLVEAHKQSQTNKKLKYNLLIIGDGSIKEELRISANENVWFYGACYDEKKISDLIYNADLCVSPGNVGLSAVHSLSYGTPIITHDNFENQMPEFEAIVKGVTGDFFEEQNLDSLNECIQNWIKQNPIKTEKIIADCFEVIDSKYNPKTQVKIFKNFIKPTAI